MTYTNSAGTYNYTLQPNGTMTYNNIVVPRIGGKPSPERAAAPSTAAAAPYPEKQVHFNNATALFHAGQAAANEESASGLSKAAENFLNAATEYHKAGDFKNERIARANAGKVAKEAERGEAAKGNGGPLRQARRPNPTTPSSRESNSAGKPGEPNASSDDRLAKYSLRKQMLCTQYRAELEADTGQSPVYTKELTAAVKGACN